MNWNKSLWLFATIITVAVALTPIKNPQNTIHLKNTIVVENVGENPPNQSSGDDNKTEDVDEDNAEPAVPSPTTTETTYMSKDYTTDITIDVTTGASTEVGTTVNTDVITDVTTDVTLGTPTESGTTPANDVVIQTNKGPVRGFHWHGSKEIRAYLDIPYGRFNNPFEAPTEPDSWEEIREVYEHNSRCPQLHGDSYVGSTDCLTLSIFTPINTDKTSVLFHIHESDFISGSGDPAIYGPEFLVPKNVILILPNYRLGPLGFLCLRNVTAPGNAGLKDLALALEWTKNNIKAFGGDPSSIAVSGYGTSAALAGYLALSPVSNSLFTKVITDSGSVLSHWAIDRNVFATAEALANMIRSNAEGEILDNVFANVSVETLLISAKDVKLRPCIEIEGFITDTPWNILQNKESNITFIIGSANHAGLIEALKHDEESITGLSENFATMLPNDLTFSGNDLRNYVSERLKRQYFGEGNITLEHAKELSLYHTDASYLGPCVRFARALVDAGGTVFLYEFSFVGLLNKELESIQDAPAFGAVRGDAIGYLFAQDGRIPVEGSKEREIMDLMTDLWTSFLRSGEPTSGELVWLPINATDPAEDWLAIGAEASSENGLHVDRLQLWSDIYRDHFIDRSAAFGLTPYNALVLLALLNILR